MGDVAEPLTERTEDASEGEEEESGCVASKRCNFEALER